MCKGQDEWIEGMVKVMVECCEPNDRLGDKPENGWFYKDYFWPMRNGKPRKDAKNEVKTIDIFYRFSQNLQNSIQNVIDKKHIQGIIGEILHWGAINKQNLPPVYQKIITNNQNQSLIQNMLENLCPDDNERSTRTILEWAINQNSNQEREKYRLSSWSKILSAIAPGRFFIYDARARNSMKTDTP